MELVRESIQDRHGTAAMVAKARLNAHALHCQRGDFFFASYRWRAYFQASPDNGQRLCFRGAGKEPEMPDAGEPRG